MAAALLHLLPEAVPPCFVLAAVLLLWWWIRSRSFLSGGVPPQRGRRPARTAGAAPTARASGAHHLPHFLVLCFSMGVALQVHAEPLLAAIAQIGLRPGAVVGAVAAVFSWAILSLNFKVALRQADGERPRLDRSANTRASAASAPVGPASRTPLPPFIALCLCTGALMHAELLVDAADQLRLHPGVVTGIVLTVAALLNWSIHSLICVVARRQAEPQPGVLFRPTATAESTPAPRSLLPPFIVLFVTTGALMHAEALVDAADQLLLHPSVVVSTVLTVTALFNWAIHSLISFVARRQAEPQPGVVFRTTTTTESTPIGSAPRSLLAPFTVLCIAVGAVMHAEALVNAAVKLRLHPDVLSCIALAVAVVFYLSVISLNFLMSHRPAERHRQAEMPLSPTDHTASAFLILSVLMSASFFVEPFPAAAAQLGLPSAVVVLSILSFAALFNIHIYRSFFVHLLPPAAPAAVAQGKGVGPITAAARWEWVGAITAAGVGVGIASCLVAAGGSAPAYAPARR